MAEMSESPMLRGPTGLTTVLTGEMAIRAGAMLRPWCKLKNVNAPCRKHMLSHVLVAIFAFATQ